MTVTRSRGLVRYILKTVPWMVTCPQARPPAAMDKDRTISSGSRRVKKDKSLNFCDITTKKGYTRRSWGIFNDDLTENPSESMASRSEDGLFDHAGEMLVFKELDFFGQGFRGIVRFHYYFCLKDGLAVVVEFVDVVDSDPAFFFSRRDDCFVDMPAIHPFTTVSGQEGGVDIDDPVPIGLNEFCRYFPQKTSQHEEIDATGAEFGDVGRTAEKGFFFDQ